MKQISRLMNKKQTVYFRVRPYIQEAVLVGGFHILIVVLLLIGLAHGDISISWRFAICGIYFIALLSTQYRMLILALIDMKRCDYITEIAGIKLFKEELLGVRVKEFFSLKRTWFDENIQRYKVEVIDKNGKKKILRTITSTKRAGCIQSLDHYYQIKDFKITYLKRSKILIAVDLAEELDKNISKKEKKTIEKELRIIRNSI